MGNNRAADMQIVIDSLGALRDDVAGLRAKQDEHAEKLTEVATSVKVLVDLRPAEREEMKKDARRWGFVGGAAASATAIVGLLAKLAFPFKN